MTLDTVVNGVVPSALLATANLAICVPEQYTRTETIFKLQGTFFLSLIHSKMLKEKLVGLRLMALYISKPDLSRADGKYFLQECVNCNLLSHLLTMAAKNHFQELNSAIKDATTAMIPFLGVTEEGSPIVPQNLSVGELYVTSIALTILHL